MGKIQVPHELQAAVRRAILDQRDAKGDLKVTVRSKGPKAFRETAIDRGRPDARPSSTPASQTPSSGLTAAGRKARLAEIERKIRGGR